MTPCISVKHSRLIMTNIIAIITASLRSSWPLKMKQNRPMGSWTIITFLLKNRIKHWEQILEEAVLSFKLVCTGGFEARSCYGGRIFSIIIITFSAIWLLTLHWFFTDSSSDLYFEVVCTGGVEARGCWCSIMIIIFSAIWLFQLHRWFFTLLRPQA